MMAKVRFSKTCSLAMAMALSCAAATPAAAAASAEAGWNAVTGCARQISDQARHACLDQVLRDAGLLASSTARATVAPTAPVNEPQTSVPQAAPQPPPAPVAATPPAPTTPVPATPDRMETQVASVSTSALGRITITARDGTVWRQTESLRLPRPPMAGDVIQVRKGALGSYICAVGSNPSYRCAPGG